jgi:hypothetical protein
VNNIIEQLGCLLDCSHGERLVFNPLGEFVNGDINIFGSLLGPP